MQNTETLRSALQSDIDQGASQGRINLLEDDRRVLELSVKALTDALREIVADCEDADGQPKAPSRRALLRAKASLPRSA